MVRTFPTIVNCHSALVEGISQFCEKLPETWSPRQRRRMREFHVLERPANTNMECTNLKEKGKLVYWGNIGIMEKKTEATIIVYWGVRDETDTHLGRYTTSRPKESKCLGLLDVHRNWPTSGRWALRVTEGEMKIGTVTIWRVASPR